jgi:hypothetical protein
MDQVARFLVSNANTTSKLGLRRKDMPLSKSLVLVVSFRADAAGHAWYL